MCKKWIQAVLAIPISGAIAFLNGVETPANLEGFKRPLVSLTFDDGWESAYTEVLPLLDWYKMPATFYIISNVIGEKRYLSKEELLAIFEKGHEIGAHSIDHSDLANLLPSLVEEQLARPKKLLEALIKVPVTDFAAPYGSVSPAVLKLLPKYYASNRSSKEGYNTMIGFNRYGLLVQQIKRSTTIDEIKAQLEFAQKNRFWLIYMYHQVDEGDLAWSTTTEKFEQQLKAIQDSNIPVVTVREGLIEVMQQISGEDHG